MSHLNKMSSLSSRVSSVRASDSSVYQSVRGSHHSVSKRVKLSPEEIEVEKVIQDFVTRVREKFGLGMDAYFDKVKSLLPQELADEADPKLLEQALIVCEMIADGKNANNHDPHSQTTKESILQSFLLGLHMSADESAKYIISFFEECEDLVGLSDDAKKDSSYENLVILAYDEMVKLRNVILNDVDAKIYELDEGNLVFVPPQISLWTKLETLTLSDHKISYLPPQVEKMQSLKKLCLKMNLMCELPENITKIPNLIELDISVNDLIDLPDDFTNLNKLETLDLSLNEFQTFPSILFEMTSLKVLDIGVNDIEVLPEEIGKLVKLEVLDLSANYIKSLPESLLQLTKLKWLSLQGMDSLKWTPLLQTLRDRGCKIIGIEPVNGSA